MHLSAVHLGLLWVSIEMNIDTDPVLKFSKSQPIDSGLCILCQEQDGKPLVDNPMQIDYIIQTLTSAVRANEGPFVKIIRRVEKTEHQILRESSYHLKCYKYFLALEHNKKRQSKNCSSNTTNHQQSCQNLSTTRVSRSSITPFHPSKCLFCQEETSETLHLLGTDKKLEDTRDKDLKQALAECPESLGVINIRYQRAYDSRAGDLLYHKKCWIINITRRIPDYTPSGSFDEGEKDSIVKHDNSIDICELEAEGKENHLREIALAEVVSAIKKSLVEQIFYNIRQAVNAYDVSLYELN